MSAVTALLLVGCGGGGSSDASSTQPLMLPTDVTVRSVPPLDPVEALQSAASTREAASNEHAQTAATAPSATPRPQDADKAAVLNRALLTIDDLPAGWSASADAGPGEDAGVCNKTLADNSLARVGASFAAGDDGPFVVHAVSAYSAGEAKRFIDGVRQALASCTEWTSPNEGGDIRWKVEPLSFASFGEDTVAAKLSSEDSTLGALLAQIVLVRRGDFVMIVGQFGVGGAVLDAAELERLVRRADERLAAIAS